MSNATKSCWNSYSASSSGSPVSCRCTSTMWTCVGCRTDGHIRDHDSNRWQTEKQHGVRGQAQMTVVRRAARLARAHPARPLVVDELRQVTGMCRTVHTAKGPSRVSTSVTQ